MSEATSLAATPAAPPEEKKKGSKLIPLIAGVVLLLGGAGGGGYWWLHRGTKVEAAEAKSKPPKERGIVSFEPFVVNLADQNTSRFLRASVQVVLSDPEVAERIQKKPVELLQLRSAILDQLTVQTSEHLVTPEGKTALKKSINEQLSPLVEGSKVLDVLFSDFVIQF